MASYCEFENGIALYDDRLCPKDYIFKNLLSQGDFGRVYLAERLMTPCPDKRYALKVLDMAPILVDQKRMEHLKNERDFFDDLLFDNNSKSNFVTPRGVAFQTKSKLIFQMEYAPGGDLERQMQKGPFTEDKAKFYLSEIILGIEFLHRNNIIHRDIAAKNIVITNEGHVQIIDFGVCKKVQKGTKTYTLCGTLEYMSPEIITETGHDLRTDIWSFAVLAYKMLVGKSPFIGKSREEIMTLILLGETDFPRKMNHTAKRFIEKMLTGDMEARSTIPQIKQDEFFSGFDWESTAKLKAEPPFIPKLSDDLDVKYFDKKLTSAGIESFECPEEMELHRFEGFRYIVPEGYEPEQEVTKSIQKPKRAPRKKTTTTNAKKTGQPAQNDQDEPKQEQEPSTSQRKRKTAPKKKTESKKPKGQ